MQCNRMFYKQIHLKHIQAGLHINGAGYYFHLWLYSCMPTPQTVIQMSGAVMIMYDMI